MDPVVTELGIIGQGVPWAISGGTHTQSIIQGVENIVHSDVITHMLTNPDQVSLESNSFPFDPLQAKTLMVTSLVESLLASNGKVRSASIIGESWPNQSRITAPAYFPITCQKGFNQRCDHERLRLKWVERKRVSFESHLVRVRQDMSVDVTANYVLPSLNNALGMASPANSPRYSLSNDTEYCDVWVHVSGSTF